MTARFSVVRQSAVSERTMELVRKRYMSPSDVWGYSWGFDALNQKTGGIHAKEDSGTNELTILGARSNVGKSSFAQTVSVNLAMQFAEEYPGLQVRVISLEMSPAALYRRAVGQLAGVRLWSMMTGRMTPDELRRLEKADRKKKHGHHKHHSQHSSGGNRNGDGGREGKPEGGGRPETGNRGTQPDARRGRDGNAGSGRDQKKPGVPPPDQKKKR